MAANQGGGRGHEERASGALSLLDRGRRSGTGEGCTRSEGVPEGGAIDEDWDHQSLATQASLAASPQPPALHAMAVASPRPLDPLQAARALEEVMVASPLTVEGLRPAIPQPQEATAESLVALQVTVALQAARGATAATVAATPQPPAATAAAEAQVATSTTLRAAKAVPIAEALHTTGKHRDWQVTAHTAHPPCSRHLCSQLPGRQQWPQAVCS